MDLAIYQMEVASWFRQESSPLMKFADKNEHRMFLLLRVPAETMLTSIPHKV